MNVQILSRKLISPSSPTPSQLESLKISAIDQLLPPVYVGAIFYYQANEMNNQRTLNFADTSNKLQKSLSEILTLFYPLAGRYVHEDLIIYCNDHGIEYLEAQVSGIVLSQVLIGKLQVEELNHFVPSPVESNSSPLVSVQANMFECGGLAIGVRVSHRIVDGFTMASFIDGWARISRAGIDKVQLCPSFCLGTLFPAEKMQRLISKHATEIGVKMVTKAFKFDRTAISRMKLIAVNDLEVPNHQEPSRVDVVTAFLWRILIDVAKAKHGYLRPSLCTHALDLRGKTSLPIATNSCGNFFMHAMAQFVPNKSALGLNHLLRLVQEAKRNAIMDCEKPRNYEDLYCIIANSFRVPYEEFKKGEIDLYMFSSWCRSPIFEADFGWGKPAWVSGVHKPVKTLHLMEANDNGIEACLSLEETDMILFCQKPEIVAFTTSRAEHYCPHVHSRM